MNDQDNNDDIIKAKLNSETAAIKWSELQRYFAAGSVIFVHRTLDLVNVAFEFSSDNKQAVQDWMTASKLKKVTDKQASTWLKDDATVWAVVVAPWVLVQERTT